MVACCTLLCMQTPMSEDPEVFLPCRSWTEREDSTRMTRRRSMRGGEHVFDPEI